MPKFALYSKINLIFLGEAFIVKCLIDKFFPKKLVFVIVICCIFRLTNRCCAPCMLVKLWTFQRFCSNIDSKSSNNTYLNIIKILFLLFFYFLYKLHWMRKFGSNVGFRKVDFIYSNFYSVTYLFQLISLYKYFF